MRRRISFILPVTILLLIVQSSFGQYALKEADREFTVFNYKRAIDLYNRAYEQKMTKRAAQGLADSYRLTQNYQQAENWYGKLTSMEQTEPKNILYYAEALMNNSKYNEAKVQFERYAKLGENITAAQQALWQSSCDSALKWINKPTNVQLANRIELNSANSDWGAVMYKGNVVFSSDTLWEKASDKASFSLDKRTAVDPNIYGWTGKPYLKLYEQQGNEIKLFPLHDSGGYHTGAASFNGAGTTMYFTMTRILNKEERKKSRNSKLITLGVEIYSSELQNGKWSIPVPFRYNNIAEWSVGDPFITPDGKQLYFISNKPGGHGGTDIYVSTKQGDGSWGEAINLGDEINTTGNERSPFAVGENTLYFSSDGLPGMGGLDLFKAEKESSGKYRVVNMAYPVNSPQDDFALTFYSPSKGYFSSNRAGGKGSDDIFSFELKNEVQPIIIAGLVIDKKTGKPLQDVAVTVTNKKTASSMNLLTDQSGHYQLRLDGVSAYDISLAKENYMGRSGIEVLSADSNSLKEIKDGIGLSPVKLDVPLTLKIYYDFNKWDLSLDAKREISNLVRLLKDNVVMRIEISSHTDSRGNSKYNQELSQRRAETVVDFLRSQGIESSRFTATGYGESKLLSACKDGVSCTEDQYQHDRRTEFILIKR
ncbi:OmpA family protein [Pedobacter borealis]|uniref:OmpA family protein n=1 Tax=Pedobacter borealis TaxID=475254 RepID=UPI00049314B0|nr:OmpA family protein [Pedobacter borealis]